MASHVFSSYHPSLLLGRGWVGAQLTAYDEPCLYDSTYAPSKLALHMAFSLFFFLSPSFSIFLFAPFSSCTGVEGRSVSSGRGGLGWTWFGLGWVSEPGLGRKKNPRGVKLRRRRFYLAGTGWSFFFFSVSVLVKTSREYYLVICVCMCISGFCLEVTWTWGTGTG